MRCSVLQIIQQLQYPELLKDQQAGFILKGIKLRSGIFSALLLCSAKTSNFLVGTSMLHHHEIVGVHGYMGGTH